MSWKGERKMWAKFDFNDPYEGEIIESINNIPIPVEYIDFMKKHNGGEGDTGKSWLLLYPFEELVEINEDYQEYLKDGFIIGSNGGGELFGINGDGKYFIVPDIVEEEYLTVIGNSIENLLEDINRYWSNQ